MFEASPLNPKRCANCDGLLIGHASTSFGMLCRGEAPKPAAPLTLRDAQEAAHAHGEAIPQGRKDRSGKPRPTLILRHMARAIMAVVDAGEFGAIKYDEHPDRCNWDKVPDGLAQYTDAMLRHQLKEFAGEEIALDSGCLHAAHAAWNSLVRLELLLRKREGIEIA